MPSLLLDAKHLVGRIAPPTVLMAVLLCGTNVANGQQQHSGVLTTGDDTLTSGEYGDTYTFFASAGAWIFVMMTSSEFDPYLILKPPSCPVGGTCEQQRDNDDVQSGDERAVILVSADEAGTWTVLATSSSPGEVGKYEVTIDTDNDMSAFGLISSLILSPNMVREEDGYLEAGDKTLSSGEYVDNHAFVGQAGQAVVIDMTSSEFDPYLILFIPDKSQEDNDDWEGSSEHARLEVVLPQDGLYRVSATSFEPGETGSYLLEIRDEVPFVKD